MSKNILVVVAHPDDEVLGCGGTISKHVDIGDVVDVLILADGVTSRKDVVKVDIAERLGAAERARKILGIREMIFLGLPDNQLDNMSLIEVIRPIERVLREKKPQIVYTHFFGDLNIDHQITHRAVMTACRPIPGFSVEEVLCFEVLSSSEWNTPGQSTFSPNLFINIAKQLDRKLEAIGAYKDEMRNSPHSRSSEHVALLAKHRGYSVGVEAAEAFMACRIIR